MPLSGGFEVGGDVRLNRVFPRGVALKRSGVGRRNHSPDLTAWSMIAPFFAWLHSSPPLRDSVQPGRIWLRASSVVIWRLRCIAGDSACVPTYYHTPIALDTESSTIFRQNTSNGRKHWGKRMSAGRKKGRLHRGNRHLNRPNPRSLQNTPRTPAA